MKDFDADRDYGDENDYVEDEAEFIDDVYGNLDDAIDEFLQVRSRRSLISVVADHMDDD